MHAYRLMAMLLLTTMLHADGDLITLKDAETVSLQNHPSVGLAREETDLARFKALEAERALWPALTAKAEETFGDAENPLGTPAFTERSYGLEASQALYSGGKLHDTYHQAKATWESLQAKLTKTESDVVYGVREAGWNFIKSDRVLGVFQKALSDLETEKQEAEAALTKDLISREIYLQIESQYLQAEATVEGAEADREARLWQWTSALGLTAPPAYRPSDEAPMISTSTISLEESLRLAEQHNPDLVIQAKSAEAALYGSKAGASVYKPILSLNGFYGRSGGAFNSEPLTLSEDWRASVQLTQYFSLNTLRLSGFDQHTSPQIGQTTRTESQTATASVGILDGYQGKAAAKDALFAFHQADIQRQRTALDVANGVREAFAGWKRATAKLRIAENDLPLAKADYEIAKIKSAHREVPLSERAIWRNRLAQAQAALEEAKAGYQISAAALAHAIGIPDYLYNGGHS